MMMNEQDLPDDPHKAHGVLIHKINEHAEKMHRLDEKLDDVISENRTQNEKLDQIEKNTAGLIEIFRAGDGTIKTIKWFGKLLIWAGSISSALYALWYAIVNWPHNGG